MAPHFPHTLGTFNLSNIKSLLWIAYMRRYNVEGVAKLYVVATMLTWPETGCYNTEMTY